MTTSTEQAPTWEPRVAEKRKQCFEAIPESWRLDRTILEKLKTPLESNKNNIMELDIPRQCSILSKEEINITEDYDVAALLKALASGKLTSVDVTVAFSKRAAIAQQLVSLPLLPCTLLLTASDCFRLLLTASDCCYRSTASLRPVSRMHRKGRLSSTRCVQRASSQVRSTGCPSASRTGSRSLARKQHLDSSRTWATSPSPTRHSWTCCLT